ncbi:MAG: class I SAM-dependent methyltransferase [Prevotellaceae bacterium]|jgi:SAM-dependent methyltransferase|nr:class I SAM-dependent methyltransferase [Prevotellaceae bacterium]
MQERHRDRFQYFNEQKESSRISVLPYIQKHISLNRGTRVLEIGCGEAGNLYPFLEAGCECYGVELLETSILNAEKFYAGNPLKEHLHLLARDIYEVKPEELGGTFDVIFLRDAIEHIPCQEKFMKRLKDFMSPGGIAFFAFPPWRNPFGGHQQICENKWLGMMPYFHLLPQNMYAGILRKGGESKGKINGLLEIRETGLSINRFKRIIRDENFKVVEKTHYLINPNYEIKFGLKPRKVPKIFQIPLVQDFYTTAVYFLLKKE